MRILLVDNLLIRRYGKLRMGPGRALACGAVRGNHRLCEFSDRDLARYMGLGIRALGERLVNKALVKTARNFRPEAVLLGHCDFIRNETLAAIRRDVPGVRIAHFNVDPMCDAHPQAQMRERMESCDALFATTAGERWLKPFATGKNVVAYMPNPSDPALETLDNSRRGADDFSCDLFYAGQPRQGDPRLDFITRLSEAVRKTPLRFELVGMGGRRVHPLHLRELGDALPGGLGAFVGDGAFSNTEVARHWRRVEKQSVEPVYSQRHTHAGCCGAC